MAGAGCWLYRGLQQGLFFMGRQLKWATYRKTPAWDDSNIHGPPAVVVAVPTAQEWYNLLRLGCRGFCAFAAAAASSWGYIEGREEGRALNA